MITLPSYINYCHTICVTENSWKYGNFDWNSKILGVTLEHNTWKLNVEQMLWCERHWKKTYGFREVKQRWMERERERKKTVVSHGVSGLQFNIKMKFKDVCDMRWNILPCFSRSIAVLWRKEKQKPCGERVNRGIGADGWVCAVKAAAIVGNVGRAATTGISAALVDAAAHERTDIINIHIGGVNKPERKSHVS